MDKIKKLNKVAGCGASDLLVAAVILDPQNPIDGLNDSKKLTEKKRAELFSKFIELAVDYELVRMTPQEVDSLNVFQARMEVFTTLTFHNIIYFIQSYSFVKK